VRNPVVVRARASSLLLVAGASVFNPAKPRPLADLPEVFAEERRPLTRQMTGNRIHWTCRIRDANLLDLPEGKIGPSCAGSERLRAAMKDTRRHRLDRSTAARVVQRRTNYSLCVGLCIKHDFPLDE
jgi:hypothetical protein